MKIDYRIKNIGIAIVLFAIIYLLFFTCAIVSAQNVKRQGNTFIERIDTTRTKTLKGQVYETDYLYVDRDGKTYNVFLSANGNAFIIKVSKKSGRKYRKYIPEVTKQIQNQAK